MVRCLEDIKAHNDKMQAEWDRIYEQRRKDLHRIITRAWILPQDSVVTEGDAVKQINAIVDAVLKLDESK